MVAPCSAFIGLRSSRQQKEDAAEPVELTHLSPPFSPRACPTFVFALIRSSSPPSSSAQQGRGGGAGALLAYKYMCAVKDPAKLPPYSYGEGVSLFTDKGRPNFEIRRPLDWQRVGSTIDNDEPKIGFWVEAKRSMGFGYK